jgi:type II secretory pathway pseudopilin PulG
MREEELVGYCLGALEESESRQVEFALADPVRGPDLRRNLELIRKAMRPLDVDRGPMAPPVGLAKRTVAFVASQAAPATVPMRPMTRPAAPMRDDAEWQGASGRQWLDRMIIAASALAACVLVAPLLLESIADARARRAQRNLQSLAGSLQGYAGAHRQYPSPPGEGPLSRAGLYAPTLVSEHRLVADDGTVLVPDSALSKPGNFRIPSMDELRAAIGTPQLEKLVQDMGGDFGYTLGYRDANEVLQENRDLRRNNHPLMADAPNESGHRSDNHPKGLHHILFEDGRVERVQADDLHRDDDHLFRNHDGEHRAGKDVDDAVIGDSHHQP